MEQSLAEKVVNCRGGSPISNSTVREVVIGYIVYKINNPLPLQLIRLKAVMSSSA
jgi:hypothetical protein